MAIEFSVEEQIAAPVEEVFAVATDLERAGEWMPNFVGIERLEGEAFAVGTRWRETRVMFGKEASEELEVTRVDAPRGYDVFIDGSKGSSKRGEYRFTFEFEERGGGTLARMRGEIDAGGRVMNFVGKLFAGAFKKACAKDLAAMKAHVEGRASS